MGTTRAFYAKHHFPIILIIQIFAKKVNRKASIIRQSVGKKVNKIICSFMYILHKTVNFLTTLTKNIRNYQKQNKEIPPRKASKKRYRPGEK
jgi:cell shape-determining protein MreC